MAATAPPSTAPPPPHPSLTPAFCFHPSALSRFLRTSRALTDDPIPEHLSALSTPSSVPFRISPTRQASTHVVSNRACSSFLAETLFPAWAARSSAISYCAQIAAGDDLDDPERFEREIQRRREQERVINERLDPYSGRVEVRESRAERLARVVKEEQVVEGIVRRRTWDVIKGRCEALDGEWEETGARYESKKR